MLLKKLKKLAARHVPPPSKYSFKSPCPQYFPFHTTLINYVLQNQSPNLHLKLSQTCKYFFSRFPLVPVEIIRMNGSVGLWKATIENHQEFLNLRNVNSKLWILHSIENIPHRRFYKLAISKIGKNDISTLTLSNQQMDFNTFKFLVSSPKLATIDLKMVYIEDEEEGEMTLDKIIAVLPKLDVFTYFANRNTNNKTCTHKLIQALKKTEIKCLKLYQLGDNFDFQMFFDYLMSQEKLEVALCFSNLSIEYQNRLQNFVDQLLVSGTKINPKPFLNFLGQKQKTANALEKLYSG